MEKGKCDTCGKHLCGNPESDPAMRFGCPFCHGHKEENRHDIKTYQDILRAVNIDNVDNFLTDIGKALRSWAAIKNIVEVTAPDSLEETIETARFVWIDDGKNDAKIGIQIKDKTAP